MNNSGNLDITDVLLLSDFISMGDFPGACPQTVADINVDGNLNIIDVIFLVNLTLYP